MGDRKRREALVTAAGVGRVEREPDMACVTLTVEAVRDTAADARLGTLVDITEGVADIPVPRPAARMMAVMAADAGTPVLPGRVEVTVSVVATWELV